MESPLTPLPAGACDCHTHVVGHPSAYPMVADRHYTPDLAPHEALLAHMQRTGVQRVVIVQPSFYGTDNRCMLDSLSRLQGAGRGIAVLDDDVEEGSLMRLHEAGVRGLRVNVESAGVRDTSAVEKPLRHWASRIADMGWHLQIYASHRTVAQLRPVLDSLPVPVVLDHFAMVPVGTSLQDPWLVQILALVASAHVYLKLSAPYRIAQDEKMAGAADLAYAFIQTCPERILWGSDWPHTNREPGKDALEVSRYREIPSASLVEGIERWLPTEDLKRQVLVTNPARLYDFPG